MEKNPFKQMAMQNKRDAMRLAVVVCCAQTCADVYAGCRAVSIIAIIEKDTCPLTSWIQGRFFADYVGTVSGDIIDLDGLRKMAWEFRDETP